MGRDITIRLLNGKGGEISSEQFRMSDVDFDRGLTILDEDCLSTIRTYARRAESDCMEEYKIEIRSKQTRKRLI